MSLSHFRYDYVPRDFNVDFTPDDVAYFERRYKEVFPPGHKSGEYDLWELIKLIRELTSDSHKYELKYNIPDEDLGTVPVSRNLRRFMIEIKSMFDSKLELGVSKDFNMDFTPEAIAHFERRINQVFPPGKQYHEHDVREANKFDKELTSDSHKYELKYRIPDLQDTTRKISGGLRYFMMGCKRDLDRKLQEDIYTGYFNRKDFFSPQF